MKAPTPAPRRLDPKKVNWRQLLIGAAAGYAAAHGVPPGTAADAAARLLNLLMPVAQ